MSVVKLAGAKVAMRPGVVVRNGERHYALPKPPPALLALRKKQRAEQERNNKIFDAQFRAELLKKRRGECAVMKNGRIAGIYSSFDDAAVAADKRYRSRVYSLHSIDDGEADLGIFSCV